MTGKKPYSNERVRTREQRAQNNAQWKLNRPEGYLFYRSQVRARRNGLEFSLTKEWLRAKLEPGVCEVTGLPFVFDMGKPGEFLPFSPSIDRKDSSKGYTLENCRVVCLVFNYACHTWGDEVVMKMARALTGTVE